MEKEIILECRDLSLGYENIILTENLSFNVAKGEYLCIVGENGAGKSTLMRTILGLQKPEKGSIRYSDETNPTDIGYLPQQTTIQRDFPASAFEVVLSGCQTSLKNRFFYSTRDKELARSNMEKLGIGDLEKTCYRHLSGGQQQRVLLARSLCAAKKMLLLDEPVSGLDPSATAEMYSIIKDLHSQGLAIIMISHDIISAVKYADTILHIGTETFFGTVKEYLASPLGRKFTETGEKTGND